MKLWWIVFAVVGASTIVLLCAGGIIVLREQGVMVRDAYCPDWASVAVVQYMDDNGNRYPSSWQDLKIAFDKATADDKSFSFEEVRERVAIDFTVEPQQSYDNSFQFVRSKSGRSARWTSPDPNERIRNRLTAPKLQAVEGHEPRIRNLTVE